MEAEGDAVEDAQVVRTRLGGSRLPILLGRSLDLDVTVSYYTHVWRLGTRCMCGVGLGAGYILLYYSHVPRFCFVVSLLLHLTRGYYEPRVLSQSGRRVGFPVWTCVVLCL